MASAEEVLDRSHTPAAAAEESDTAHHAVVESGTVEASDRARQLDAVGGSQYAVDCCSTAEARAVKEQPKVKYQPSHDAGTCPVMLHKIPETREPFLVKQYSVVFLEASSQSAKVTAFAAALLMPPETERS